MSAYPFPAASTPSSPPDAARHAGYARQAAEGLLAAWGPAAGAETRVYFAPGRVNLIGEHTDYNGGDVLPLAIDLGIYLAVRPRADRLVRMGTASHAGLLQLDLAQAVPARSGGWGDYPAGVLHHLTAAYGPLPGADAWMLSTLPEGAGLSSSAALEAATALAWLHLAQVAQPDRSQLALLCQRAENQYVGVNCGIMDQFAVCNGREGHAIRLHCGTLAHSWHPFALQGYTLLAINSSSPRRLSHSEYNTRRSQCEAALAVIQGRYPQVATLADCTLEMLTASQLPDELHRRARHVISEQGRVGQACQAMQAGQWQQVGQLMDASHASLQADYEVTGPALDALVAAARQAPGCIGARMTGAGFGGCAIALVQTSQVEAFWGQVQQQYTAATGLVPQLYPCQPGAGVGRVL